MNARLQAITNPHILSALARRVIRVEPEQQDKAFADHRDWYIEQSRRTEAGKLYPFEWLRVARG